MRPHCDTIRNGRTTPKRLNLYAAIRLSCGPTALHHSDKARHLRLEWVPSLKVGSDLIQSYSLDSTKRSVAVGADQATDTLSARLIARAAGVVVVYGKRV